MLLDKLYKFQNLRVISVKLERRAGKDQIAETAKI